MLAELLNAQAYCFFRYWIRRAQRWYQFISYGLWYRRRTRWEAEIFDLSSLKAVRMTVFRAFDCSASLLIYSFYHFPCGLFPMLAALVTALNFNQCLPFLSLALPLFEQCHFEHFFEVYSRSDYSILYSHSNSFVHQSIILLSNSRGTKWRKGSCRKGTPIYTCILKSYKSNLKITTRLGYRWSWPNANLDISLQIETFQHLQFKY